MKNKLKRTTSMLCALTVAAVPMTMSAFTASATENTNTVSDYMLTIPSTFTVANEGWNEIEGGVKASGTLAGGKKLVVTAESDNGWALKSGDNAIGYNLAKENADYNANAEAPTWEFDTLTADGVSQTAGLIVDNYDEAPAGNYSDNVVFTASVESAKPADPDVIFSYDLLKSDKTGVITSEGITLTPSNGDARIVNNFYDYGSNTFTAPAGKKFAKIEIVCENYGEGWDGATSEIVGKYQPEPEEFPDYWRYKYKVTWIGDSSETTFQSDIFGVESISFYYA